MPKKTRTTGRSAAKPIGRPPNSKKPLAELGALIESARSVVAQAVNSGLVLRYWQVGNQIRSTMLGNKQMVLYPRWLEKHEMEPREETPVGLIMCEDKGEEQVELLQLDKSGIWVVAKWVSRPLKKFRLVDIIHTPRKSVYPGRMARRLHGAPW